MREMLTWVEEDDSFQASEFRVVDLDVVERFHQLVHHSDADLADVQVLLIATSI
jgi:hypothetical protein